MKSKPAPKAVKAAPKPQPKAQPKAQPKSSPKPKSAPKQTVVEKATRAVKAVAAAAREKTPKPVKAALKTAAVAAAVAAPVAKQQTKATMRAAEAPAAPAPKAAPAPAPAKAPRRARTRIPISEGGPLAAWIRIGERRPSSFIPAPPRAESPSQIAAPPASSDRLIRPDDLESLALPAIRTFPIRVEVEQAVGRTHILVQPNSVTIGPGDGVEWDFRYLGGADTFIDEIVVELAQEGLFALKTFRSRNPGSARPHRQLSGRLAEGAPKGTTLYTIRCHAFGTEIAKTTAQIIVT